MSSKSRAFGYRPAIALVWLGGHTDPRAPGPIPWHKDVALTLAGPLFGFGLALAAFGGRQALPPGSEVGAFVLGHVLWANLLWSTFNLAPVHPLDGGRHGGLNVRRDEHDGQTTARRLHPLVQLEAADPRQRADDDSKQRSGQYQQKDVRRERSLQPDQKRFHYQSVPIQPPGKLLFSTRTKTK